jgi:hypothetical protein
MKSTAVYRIVSMIALCGFSFFRYMKSAGLAGGNGLIILSSHEGANWGRRDIRRARTLISLRRLDLIKHLEMFLNSLGSLLPPDTTFVGCFAQRPSENIFQQGMMTGFLYRLARHGASGYPELSRDRVSAMLERSGLAVLDMREMNGLTFFHSRKKLDSKTNQ